MADERGRGRGELESAVLAVLHASPEALTPADVQHALGDDLAYTTVMTILARLHDKGVLQRERRGRAYAYRPVSDQAGLVARRMSQVLDTSAERDTVLARFVDDLSDADEALLRRLLGE
ncbi:MAG TPA: BlaI/MecI/CopY family transcriptional regulator [Actinomycetospora sp.]|jgi:predicted transcriptional regulator|uniref:BlaI/MecI/CopY family transcriptional regulator n=1 Tax=Actinomycetospora sp. TaxID=1872135 RepID=UPI002F400411